MALTNPKVFWVDDDLSFKVGFQNFQFDIEEYFNLQKFNEKIHKFWLEIPACNENLSEVTWVT